MKELANDLIVELFQRSNSTLDVKDLSVFPSCAIIFCLVLLLLLSIIYI
jgi:hypothetical protein